jgi:ABC-type glutathione transport system ATPase component
VTAQPLLAVEDLRVEFRRGVGRAAVVALDGVDLDIDAGETVGLVGETGAGKSTLGNAILGLVTPHSGRIRFDGADIARAGVKQRRRLSEHIQVIFQDPYGSLNPSRTVGQTLAESYLVHRNHDRAQTRREIARMLESVGLDAADADEYPTAFSGGERQRIAIARALMLRPKLVVCDEPVSSLDLSTQGQVLNLLKDLQRDFGMSMLFISHDLAVVRHMAHRVWVLHRGTVVEWGDTEQVCSRPREPYTQRLVAAQLRWPT